jgi:hypothetical protein
MRTDGKAGRQTDGMKKLVVAFGNFAKTTKIHCNWGTPKYFTVSGKNKTMSEIDSSDRVDVDISLRKI